MSMLHKAKLTASFDAFSSMISEFLFALFIVAGRGAHNNIFRSVPVRWIAGSCREIPRGISKIICSHIAHRNRSRSHYFSLSAVSCLLSLASTKIHRRIRTYCLEFSWMISPLRAWRRHGGLLWWRDRDVNVMPVSFSANIKNRLSLPPDQVFRSKRGKVNNYITEP